MPKTPAKSPGTKSTPSSRGKRDAAATPSRAAEEDMAGEPPASGAAAGAEDEDEEDSATATPAARKGGKRKAAAAAAAAGDETPSAAKKPKVLLRESVSSTSGGGAARHTRASVRLEVPVSTPTPAPAPAARPAGKHIVFDDDEPSEYFTPQEAPAQKTLDAEVPGGDDEDESDSDSDDDAPEAVSTHAAAAQAAKSAQAATSAAEKQQELQKRKRQDRDARFREQAEARGKQASKQQAAEDAGEARLGLEQPREHIPSLAPAATRKRLDKHSLPAVLPADFLEAASLDGSDGDDSEDGSEAGEGRARKARFNTAARQVARAESRRPQDQRVGSTVYRVMKKQGDVRLAPKLGRQSRNAKEAMMGRGRPAAKKAGFLAKRR